MAARIREDEEQAFRREVKRENVKLISTTGRQCLQEGSRKPTVKMQKKKHSTQWYIEKNEGNRKRTGKRDTEKIILKYKKIKKRGENGWKDILEWS